MAINLLDCLDLRKNERILIGGLNDQILQNKILADYKSLASFASELQISSPSIYLYILDESQKIYDCIKNINEIQNINIRKLYIVQTYKQKSSIISFLIKFLSEKRKIQTRLGALPEPIFLYFRDKEESAIINFQVKGSNQYFGFSLSDKSKRMIKHWRAVIRAINNLEYTIYDCTTCLKS
jgi:hypothetical protein